jgi:mono/diheme cytochrome c family protein
MNKLVPAFLALILVAGCGGGQKPSAGTDSGSGSTPAPAATPSATAIPEKSIYDNGPRAFDQGPADQAAAMQGQKLFSTKGCVACHAFGKRLTCPDLAGVTRRRTAQWMQNQILNPEMMVKTDPISHGLFATYALQMPNQHLTETEAKAVIEYFKSRDAGGAAAGKEGK